VSITGQTLRRKPAAHCFTTLRFAARISGRSENPYQFNFFFRRSTDL
jgi:hypothetical protein